MDSVDFAAEHVEDFNFHAAAAALKLNFLPLYQERYDLIIPKEHHESARLKPLLQLLGDTDSYHIEIVRPSLEDVFVTCTGEGRQ